MGATRKIRKRFRIPEAAGGTPAVSPGSRKLPRKLERNRTRAGASEYGIVFFRGTRCNMPGTVVKWK